MGRKASVVVNGKLMTGKAYEQAIVETLEETGNNFLPTAAIISIAAGRGKVEPLNAKRRAHSHPIWKILSNMTDTPSKSILDYRWNHQGLLEYRLKNPRRVMVNDSIVNN